MNLITDIDKRYDDYKKLSQNIALPAAFVDLDFLKANVDAIIKKAGHKKIRVASKSVRSVALLKYVFEHSNAFEGIMSFTIEESSFLIKNGFKDVLIGYPSMQPTPIAECMRLAKAHEAKMTFMVDCTEHVKQLNDIASSENTVARICIDIDMSVQFPGLYFGVYRSSIRNEKALYHLLASIKEYKNIDIVGLMGYEAQIAGVVDNEFNQGIKNTLVRWLKKKSIAKIRTRRASMVKIVEKEIGKPLEIVNGGGTGSLSSTTEEPKITEVTVGSGILSPHLFDNYQDFKYFPTAFFGLQVVRKPGDDIYTLHGGGYIASGSIEKLKAPQPYLPDDMHLIKNEGAGEVQTPIMYQGDLALGSPVFFRHAKAGELCERFNQLHLIENGSIKTSVPTYRGEGMCFL